MMSKSNRLSVEFMVKARYIHLSSHLTVLPLFQTDLDILKLQHNRAISKVTSKSLISERNSSFSPLTSTKSESFAFPCNSYLDQEEPKHKLYHVICLLLLKWPFFPYQLSIDNSDKNNKLGTEA